MVNFMLLLVVGSLINEGLANNFVVKEYVQEVYRERLEDNRTKVTEFIEERKINGNVYENDISIESNLLNYPFAKGLVSYDCMRCICLVESNCQKIGCRMDVGSLSCGYFQIKEAYFKDCDMKGKEWKSCADDIACASQCVQNYMKRYAARNKCPATCEGYAREHNGGPRGCKNPNTEGYWQKVQRQPGCKGIRN
uniref:lysozyme n=1 Tax=Mactra quadrangularis TaxID=120570 RepID=K9JF24_9BIVA|nr:lysozyme [Mactra quadrangularis]